MTSGSSGDDVDAEFYTTIDTRIDMLTDEINTLTPTPCGDVDETTMQRAIAARQRAVNHLRGFPRPPPVD